jgi:hypothetical protein
VTEPGGSGLRGVHQLPGSRGPAHTSLQLTEVPQAACPPACLRLAPGRLPKEGGREGRKQGRKEGRQAGRLAKWTRRNESK